MIKPLFASALLFAALHAAPAHAAVFPGASCQAVENSPGLAYDVRGRVANNGAGTLKVVCPIARENVDEGWKSVRVVVSDRHNTQNITCEAFSSQHDGDGYALTKTSTQYSPEWYQSETLTFDPPTFVRANGSFFVVCSLPPVQSGRRSVIATYGVVEKLRCAPATGSTEYAGFPGDADFHWHRFSYTDCF